MVIKALKILIMTTTLLGLVACASKRGGRGGVGADGDEMMGVDDNVRFYGSNLSSEEEDKESLMKRTYYFGYDSFDVKDEDTPSIYEHAKRLVNNPRTRVRVEGHTDERGSREYNVALAERRANAVANILMLKGVGQDQISVVSYGKEKPAVIGHDESAWSQNRRVVIVFEVE